MQKSKFGQLDIDILKTVLDAEKITIGENIVQMVRDKIDDEDKRDTGAMYNSFKYKTSTREQASTSQWDFDKPTNPDLIVISSGCPYAEFMEEGSKEHTKPEGKDLFDKRLREWVTRNFPVFTEDLFYFIKMKIIKKGLEGKHFVEQTRKKVESDTPKLLSNIRNKTMEALQKAGLK